MSLVGSCPFRVALVEVGERINRQDEFLIEAKKIRTILKNPLLIAQIGIRESIKKELLVNQEILKLKMENIRLESLYKLNKSLRAETITIKADYEKNLERLGLLKDKIPKRCTDKNNFDKFFAREFLKPISKPS